jgi:hypothetical protein
MISVDPAIEYYSEQVTQVLPRAMATCQPKRVKCYAGYGIEFNPAPIEVVSMNLSELLYADSHFKPRFQYRR